MQLKSSNTLREPLKIHFGGQANLFDSGRHQEKTALALAKADFPSLPEYKNILLAAQKQLLEPPLTFNYARLGAYYQSERPDISHIDLLKVNYLQFVKNIAQRWFGVYN